MSLQAISVLAGLSILLLIAAPFVIVSVPCILCAKCHRVYLQRRLRKRHGDGLVKPHATEPLSSCQSEELSRRGLAATAAVEADPAHPSTMETTKTTVVAEKVDIHWSDGVPHITIDSHTTHNPDISSTVAPSQSVLPTLDPVHQETTICVLNPT
ncbi:unnamed protein product [Echinostoma caproni]|uniref:LITAF domain-containing protein n=1 Tax=Echinostoma caproni TaxID=27848 RepID=A0A183A3D3_9TREM|nr:unnamed protein product [Echinostoma caproni]